jgi:hypothetical protein
MKYPPELSYQPETRVVLVGTTECPRGKDNLPPLPQVAENIHELERLFTDTDIVGLPPASIVRIVNREEASEIVTDSQRLPAKQPTL